MKLFETDDDVPDEEAARRFVRTFCGDDVLVTSGTGSKNDNHLHIPDTNHVDAKPLCSTGVDIDWFRKSLSVYPMGFKPFCRRCLARAFPEQAAVNFPEVER